MWLVCDAAHYELALVPFTTSIIMVFGSPDSPLTRPRNLIGGHILCSVVTLIVVSALGYAPWVSMVAVGFAMCLMMITRTLHPPAGMSIFVIVTMHAGWSYLVTPVAVGAIALAAYASMYFSVSRLVLGAFRRRPA
jgi:CBS-domain-containing membrane protein